MHSITLDVSDAAYEKVMRSLSRLSKRDLRIREVKVVKESRQDSLVDFFRKSPLVGEVVLEREVELYTDRVIL